MDKQDLEKAARNVKTGIDNYSYWKSKARYAVSALIGLSFLVYGGYRTYSMYTFQKKGLHAEAVVINYREEKTTGSNNQPQTSYIPILRFTSAAGDTITTEYNLASNPPEFEKGETVTVYYYESNPTRIETVNQVSFLIFGGMAALGLVLFGVGTFRVIRG